MVRFFLYITKFRNVRNRNNKSSRNEELYVKINKFQNHPSHPSRLHTDSDNFVSVPQPGMHFLQADGLKENTEQAIVATLQKVCMGSTKFFHNFNQGQSFEGFSGQRYSIMTEIAEASPHTYRSIGHRLREYRIMLHEACANASVCVG